MDPKLTAALACLCLVYISNTVYGKENASTHVNVTKIRYYDQVHARELLRAEITPKTTFHTVCRPRVLPTGIDVIISDMTHDSRVGPGSNFEFVKVADNHTLGADVEVLDSTTVKDINECVRRCSSNHNCKTYVYEGQGRTCKLTVGCKPSLTSAGGAQVFSMSFWY